MQIAKRAILTLSAHCAPLRDGLLRAMPPRDRMGQYSDRWEREYAANGWAWLNNNSERLHNHLIAAYCSRLGPDASVLDVGCGEGVLQAILERFGYARYLGIDVAATAVARMASRADGRTRFQVADATTFTTDERFDAVVLNEVLYYFADPAAVLARLARLAHVRGYLVVSMAQVGMRDALLNQRIWRDADRLLHPVDRVSLRYAGGGSRTIAMFERGSGNVPGTG